jgi:hypothetical protein
VIRPGLGPAIGREGARALLAKTEEPTQYGEAKGEVSRTGDLGITWGEYTDAGGGYYLRLWRHDHGGAWQLALDLLHPR